VRLRNVGGRAVAWSATPSVAWLSAVPGSGTLGPDAGVSFTVSIDRTQAPEGRPSAAVAVRGDGAPAGDVAVTATVSRPPAIGSVTATPPRLSVRGCGISVQSVAATVSDAGGVAAVELVGSGPDGSFRVPMRSGGGSTWNGSLGPFSRPGTVRWQVVATDVAGATTSGATRSTPARRLRAAAIAGAPPPAPA